MSEARPFLPFALPDIGEEEIAEVVDTLRSGWVTTGPKARRFEQDFAAFLGARARCPGLALLLAPRHPERAAEVEALVRARGLATVRRSRLPADREADVVVIATADTCIGGAEAEHDLSGLAGHRLRTHGGVSEAKVPFILSAPLNDAYRLKAGAATPKSGLGSACSMACESTTK